MKELIFPGESYLVDAENGSYKFFRTPTSVVGIFELLWSAVNTSPAKLVSKREHKTNKGLKAKLREISEFKDKDLDSRILRKNANVLLEDAEFDMLKRHMDAASFNSVVSETVDDIWDIIDGAKLYHPVKPTLEK